MHIYLGFQNFWSSCLRRKFMIFCLKLWDKGGLSTHAIKLKSQKGNILKCAFRDLQDAAGVRHGDHLPPPQIHQKYMYMWNDSYRTPTEHRQKTSDFPKGKKLPRFLGRREEKRKNRDKRMGTGLVPVGGNCEGGKVSTH